VVAAPSDSARDAMRITFDRSKERGRDSWGLQAIGADGGRHRVADIGADVPVGIWGELVTEPCVVIGNRRAEPPSEWVRVKSQADIQPFESPSGRWLVSHNGIINNDQALLAEAGVTAPPTRVDAYAIGVALERYGFREALDRLEGSYAIVAADRSQPDRLFVACNYQPLFARGTPDRGLVEVASQADYLDHDPLGERLWQPSAVEIPPYSFGYVTPSALSLDTLYPPIAPEDDTVLAVCSGGLDSTTAAFWHARRLAQPVTLMHIDYGQKAARREHLAVQQLGQALGVPVVVFPTDLWTKYATGSTLTDPGKQPHTGRYGEDGAELHHDLVNARNFALSAFTTVLGDARGFHAICLGTNLTEASVYPDNNQQFMKLLQALMAYAAKPYHRITISQPVGTLMKQEIIRLGLELGVPYELTYSCYFGRDKHCGQCGSCYNRHLAFRMNNERDPTDYEVIPSAGPVPAVPRGSHDAQDRVRDDSQGGSDLRADAYPTDHITAGR
jgi:7-cyano-7-deazaguanine synthase